MAHIAVVAHPATTRNSTPATVCTSLPVWFAVILQGMSWSRGDHDLVG